jgi:hypothetical protein
MMNSFSLSYKLTPILLCGYTQWIVEYRAHIYIGNTLDLSSVSGISGPLLIGAYLCQQEFSSTLNLQVFLYIQTKFWIWCTCIFKIGRFSTQTPNKSLFLSFGQCHLILRHIGIFVIIQNQATCTDEVSCSFENKRRAHMENVVCRADWFSYLLPDAVFRIVSSDS